MSKFGYNIGEELLCIKNFYMNRGDIAFKEGVLYKIINKKDIEGNLLFISGYSKQFGNALHQMKIETVEKHFRRFDELNDIGTIEEWNEN